MKLVSMLSCLAAVLCSATTAGAVLVVVPAENELFEGNSGNSFPFSAPEMRYQQVYDGAALSGAGGIVEAILFRVDSSGAGFANAMLDVEIRLSNTAVTPATMSLTFADNIGADETLVFDGVLTISGTGGGSPNPFDILIDIADVFSYDGASNLLFDIRVLSGTNSGAFDSVSTSAGASSVQRVWSLDVGAATGTIIGDRGLVTAFQFATPPTVGIEIDVSPNSETNFVRPGGRGPVPVAILGTAAFDVADVDVTTLAFGPSGAAPKEHPTPRIVDANRDGFDDLLVRFRALDTGIVAGDSMACLTGETLGGTPFEGCDSIQTMR